MLGAGFSASVTGTSLTLRADDGTGLVYRIPNARDSGAPGASPAATPPSATPSPTVADPDPIDPPVRPSGALEPLPPIVTVDGIAGRIVSWCGPNADADGALDAAPNPLVTNPTRLALPATAAAPEVQVMASDSTVATVSVDGAGRIGPIPPGSWQYLLVSVQLSYGGNAAYAWSLAR